MQNNKSKQNQAKNEILTDWQRIEMVIQQSKLTVNAFARHIGLPRGENLYQIKKGNNFRAWAAVHLLPVFIEKGSPAPATAALDQVDELLEQLAKKGGRQ